MLAAGSYLIYTFRISLIHIFISEPEVVQLSQDYIVILALIFPLMAVLQTCLGAFQGSGHTKYVLFFDHESTVAAANSNGLIG